VTTSELVQCIGCLHPASSFQAFDRKRLIRMTEFYPRDFANVDLDHFDNQLQNYIIDVRTDSRFSELNRLSDLAKKLVHTKKHQIYPFVYYLVKLALILPVATATVERVFSAMKFIKNDLCNTMNDDWLNECLVTYVERDLFSLVSIERIIDRFQSMKTRRVQIPKLS